MNLKFLLMWILTCFKHPPTPPQHTLARGLLSVSEPPPPHTHTYTLPAVEGGGEEGGGGAHP